jgi:hypothetical protein
MLNIFWPQENVAEQVRLIIADCVPTIFNNIFLGRCKIQIKQSVNQILRTDHET